MPRKKMVWKIYPYFLVITLISLLILGVFASGSLKRFYIGQVEKELRERANTLKDLIEQNKSLDIRGSVDAECKKLGHMLSNRFTVVLPEGTVIGDSERDPKTMENHSDRPEIAAALKSNEPGISQRYSYTLEEDMLYVAVPLVDRGKVLAVVRASNSIEEIDKGLGRVYWKIIILGLLLLILSGALALWVSNQKISKPLYEIKMSADRLAMGDLKIRVNVPYSEETEAISKALNKMASELDDRISTVTRQRNELEAVLKSMIEAVIVIDMDERVMRINETAGRLFGAEPLPSEGKTVQEVVRNTAIERFIKKTIDMNSALQEEIAFGLQDKIVQASGSVLKGLGGDPIGILVVLNDITRLKKLENLRKDFVSNVSHELKTPITSIKGFIETLKEGAIEDPEARNKFLDIITSQSDRLAKIIDDLLSISKMEKMEETEIEKESTLLKEVINSAKTFCEGAARDKDISIKIKCEDDLTAKINPILMEQALTNLIDNAIKYSESGKAIEITAEKKASEILIKVKDQGIGISKEHLDRIFERFYRVDKARSRKQGGTGLGLSIVKHIVHAHKGKITVESKAGAGSIFTISIPS